MSTAFPLMVFNSEAKAVAFANGEAERKYLPMNVEIKRTQQRGKVTKRNGVTFAIERRDTLLELRIWPELPDGSMIDNTVYVVRRVDLA